jgi:hypothetical protein
MLSSDPSQSEFWPSLAWTEVALREKVCGGVEVKIQMQVNGHFHASFALASGREHVIWAE